jgi:hypothetical protein
MPENVTPGWEDRVVLPIQEQSFDYGVALHEDFESLLGERPGRPIASQELVRLAFERGRVLLQARAGAGKTTILNRLVAARHDLECDVRIADLSVLDASDKNWPTSDDAEAWLSRCIGDSSGPLLLCVDSLDELTPPVAQRVLDATDLLTRNTPTCAVLVSDRLGRRSIRRSRWGLAGLTEVSAQFVGQRAGGQETTAAWQRLPYYLRITQGGSSGENPPAVLERLLLARLGGNPESLDELSAAALRWWQHEPSGVIPLEWLRLGLDEEVTATLLEAGLLISVPGREDVVEFDHALTHAFLASRALAHDPTNWRRENFEALTFRGSNFEALGLLLGQVEDAEVDHLVRTVDDWNFYAAGYLLAEDEDAGQRTSDSLRAALLLLLGRRRFAQVPSTRIQVEDSLRLHGGPLARKILEAKAEDDLIRIAESVSATSDWWPTWLTLFTRTPGSTAREIDMTSLASSDGLLGWTAANVLLRLKLHPEQRNAIERIAKEHPDETCRWRAVHVLGSSDDEETLEFCLDVFENDNSAWVRYGALRSFILIAARMPEATDRAEAFKKLASQSPVLLANAKWKREIERSVQIGDPPPDWPIAVGVLLEQLWAMSETVEEQDRWRNLSALLRTGWRSVSEIGSPA